MVHELLVVKILKCCPLPTCTPNKAHNSLLTMRKKDIWQNNFVVANTLRGFHVETTWKWSLPRRFNVEYTWCVCSYLVILLSFFDEARESLRCENEAVSHVILNWGSVGVFWALQWVQGQSKICKSCTKTGLLARRKIEFQNSIENVVFTVVFCW